MSESERKVEAGSVIYAYKWRSMTKEEMIETLYIALNVLKDRHMELDEKNVIDLANYIEILNDTIRIILTRKHQR
jgi:hypothetical protein